MLIVWHHAGSVRDVPLAGRGLDRFQPLFPLVWGLGRVVGVQQEVPADRAPAALPPEQLEAYGVQRGSCLVRRLAQYLSRAGSSGDALPFTITCRSIFVQASFGR